MRNDTTLIAPDGKPWDGKVHSYRPAPEWRERVSPELSLQDEVADDLDPVTYEILRNRLWTVNLSHGETLARISGSPAFASLDFNMTILAEDGEAVMSAPYIQFLNAGAPYAVRYILENLSHSPGISEGDIFLANDPWITAVHQMDVLIVAPVFVDGELFAWISNAGHQYDLGGIAPGGWPQNAENVYSDPIVLPPFKIIEAGVRREDLEAVYLRQSRLPDFVELDLRAQLVGAAYARDQIATMCEEFGKTTVKAAMKRILDQSEKSFRDILSRIPDGTWSSRRYTDQRLPGLRETFALQVNMTKEGDRLIIDNEGTDPQQIGSISFPYLLFVGGTLAVLSVSMLYDQMFSIGGAERAVEYRMTPGALNCADYPSAVAGSIMGSTVQMASVHSCVSRMLACDPERADDVFAPGPDWPLGIVAGEDESGGFYGQGLFEAFAQGGGARRTRDGVNTGGPSWSPLSRLLDCEANEQWYPLIYLYRRELIDSGGAGRTRGGVGLSFAITPYRAKSMTLTTNTGGVGSSAFSSEGLFGGYPVPLATIKLLKETELKSLFESGQMPADLDEIPAGATSLIAGKSNGTMLESGDVVEFTILGGGGYGDPLLRDPLLVATDVANGYVSAEVARETYGVVLEADGAVADAATEDARAAIIDQRGEWQALDSAAAAFPEPGGIIRPVHAGISVRGGDDAGDLQVCDHCDSVICRAEDDYKRFALRSVTGVDSLPGATIDSATFIDDRMDFILYCCPSCKVLLTTEVVREGSESFPDMVLVPGSLAPLPPAESNA
jgi:N-methylhydantoinase B